MKPLFLIIFAGSLNLFANTGDPFYTDLNGVKYYCTPTQDQPNNPIGAVDCANKAYSGPFSRDEAQQLCSGAQSVAPADCGIKAYSGVYSKVEAIQLCKGANSNAPIDCANKAYSGPFSRAESISLCIGANSTGPAECAKSAYSGPFSKSESLEICSSPSATVANADCAKKAYAGPYTKEQAVALCKGSHLVDGLVADKKLIASSNETAEQKQIVNAKLIEIKKRETSLVKALKQIDSLTKK